MQTFKNHPSSLYAWKLSLFELPPSLFLLGIVSLMSVLIFFRQLDDSMQVLDRENKEIILLGDNCDIFLNYSDGDSLNSVLSAHSMHVLELYDLFGFYQLMKRGTRETLESTTLDDHIATTNKPNIPSSGVHGTNISGHDVV